VGGTALGLGRGEQIYPLEPLPRWWVVLVFPPFGVPTASAYEWLDDLRANGAAPAELRYLPGSWLGRTVPLANDLEAPVVARHPVIGKLTDRLIRLGAILAGMSGSGSTVFGIFTTAAAAASASRRLHATGASTLVTRMRKRP